MNMNLPEFVGMKKGVVAGTTGARITAGQSDRVGFLVLSTAACVLTLHQHNAATAGVTKDLATDNYSYNKLDTDFSFTAYKPADLVKSASYNVPAASLFYVEVEASQLDTNGGFGFLSATTDVSATVLYFAVDTRQSTAYEVAL